MAYQVLETHKSYQNNPENSMYLKAFGEIEPISLEKRQLTELEAILEAIGDVKNSIIKTNKRSNRLVEKEDLIVVAGIKQQMKVWIKENSLGWEIINGEYEIDRDDFSKMIKDLNLPQYTSSRSEALNLLKVALNEMEVEELLR